MVEQDMSDDLRSRVVQLEHKTASNDQRLGILEGWRIQRDTESARHDERWSHMEKRLEGIEFKITKLGDALAWVAKTFVGAILAGIVVFMLKGGFSI